jgi:metal-sulfur cluster biosynthetic enzyme
MDIASVISGLREVRDPEIGLNVVDMGLIYQLRIDEISKKILVVMTLTTQFCPMGHAIVDGVEHNLLFHFPDYTIQVSVTFDPVWSQQMISQAGIEFLSK